MYNLSQALNIIQDVLPTGDSQHNERQLEQARAGNIRFVAASGPAVKDRGFTRSAVILLLVAFKTALSRSEIKYLGTFPNFRNFL